MKESTQVKNHLLYFDKTSVNSVDVKTHDRIHIDKKPFACTNCNKNLKLWMDFKIMKGSIFVKKIFLLIETKQFCGPTFTYC